jgi:ATP-dependent Lhr-like helicase
MSEIEDTLKIKKQLKSSWSVFFSKFGKLTPIQLQAIPVILSGNNVMIISATASGKTEAVIAPISEILLKRGIKGLSVIYIVPTRALANDIIERIGEQLTSIGMVASIKTGDKPYFMERSPPNILITTPESLDSMLCRHSNALAGVKMVVLDEIHNIDGMYRGDQLRLNLLRLKEIAGDFSVYALSATIQDPENVAARYMNTYKIVKNDGVHIANRIIEDIYTNSTEAAFVAAKRDGIKKLLVFCNSRRKAEELSIHAKKIWGIRNVVVHHGSLSKAERLDTEMFMKKSRVGICLCTSTLEIGIDIGDVEAIVLSDIPFTVSSLLQRIGRGGRRIGKVRVYAVVNDENNDHFHEMMDAAKKNDLEKVFYLPDISVVVQQIFSMLFASSPQGLEEDTILKLFNRFCSLVIIQYDIIPHLIYEGYIFKRNNKLYASPVVMDMGEKGKIHSNIPDTKSLIVIDITQNKQIGEVQLNISEIQGENTFILSGRTWRIEKILKNKVLVKPSYSAKKSAQFNPRMQFGAFFGYLPKDLRQSEIGLRKIANAN